MVFNAQSTNEDLYALARLAFDHLRLGKAYLAGLDQGWSDDILVCADKNPNTAGAMAIGGGPAAQLLDLANDLKAGAVTDAARRRRRRACSAGDAAPAALPLDSSDAGRARHAPRTRSTAAAHVALPLAEWAEVDGTFTNRLGMVQRVRAAVPPAGDSLPGLGDPVAPGAQAGRDHGLRRGRRRSSPRPSRSCPS